MTSTRRDITKWMGLAGSSAAAFQFGFSASAREATAPTLTVNGAGKSVVIIGGGIAGLTAAHELEKAGYKTTIVEARTRLGGRNWTWRDGEKVEHRDGQQTVRFADGQYFNAGPARIPGFHHNLLSYCRAFGVALEPFLYENQNAFLVSPDCQGGKRMRHRHVRYSIQSAIEDVAIQGLDYGILTEGLSAEQAGRVKALIKQRSMSGGGPFNRSYRGGMVKHLDASLKMPDGLKPIPLAELAKSNQLGTALSTYDWIEWQSSLMQPVGGMDSIVKAFDRNVKAERLMGTELVGINQDDGTVSCRIRERRNGKERTLSADFCVVTAGLPILDKADLKLSNAHRNAVTQGAKTYEHTSKVAWAAKRRFWELDDDIYGGASSLDGLPMQFWYPSSGYGTKSGVVLGAYTAGPRAEAWNKLSLEKQLATSAGFGRTMHQAFDDDVIAGYNIDWMDQTYSKGGWAWLLRNGEAEEGSAYEVLREPDGRIAFAGDYLSQLSGWQEGAILSAHRAVQAIAAAT